MVAGNPLAEGNRGFPDEPISGVIQDLNVVDQVRLLHRRRIRHIAEIDVERGVYQVVYEFCLVGIEPIFRQH